jgi:ubiquinol-cytochrome c reductase iron-sulfur subunit
MPDPGRRTFIGAAAWTMGAVGLGAIGYTLFRATEPPGVDPRVRVELPEKPVGFYRTVSSNGRPVGVRGLTPAQVAELNLAPGAPPYVVLDLVCTYRNCLVGAEADPVLAPWVCMCCGQRYSIGGKHLEGPAKRDLAMPPYSFAGRRTVLIGPRFTAT